MLAGSQAHQAHEGCSWSTLRDKHAAANKRREVPPEVFACLNDEAALTDPTQLAQVVLKEDMRKGDKVVVRGLKGKPEYNGKVGRLGNYSKKHERYEVHVVKEKNEWAKEKNDWALLVKAENLVPLALVHLFAEKSSWDAWEKPLNDNMENFDGEGAHFLTSSGFFDAFKKGLVQQTIWSKPALSKPDFATEIEELANSVINEEEPAKSIDPFVSSGIFPHPGLWKPTKDQLKADKDYAALLEQSWQTGQIPFTECVVACVRSLSELQQFREAKKSLSRGPLVSLEDAREFLQAKLEEMADQNEGCDKTTLEKAFILCKR